MVSTLVKHRIAAVIVFLLLQLAIGYLRFSEGFSAFDLLHLTLLGGIFLIWLVLFVDLFRNRIYNKTFWIFAFIIAPIYAPAFYLFQRKSLNHLAENKFRSTT